MMVQEELTHSPALDAATYRQLWLDREHRLGIIAEILADVLGWQPSPDQWLPDAEELANAAAARIIELERAAPCRQNRLHIKTLHSVHYALN